MKLKIKHIKYSFLCMLIVFLSNFFIPSLTNGFAEGINFSVYRIWSNQESEDIFNTRYSKSEYRRRPFVLEFQLFAEEKLDLPYQFSFNLINYICLFLIFLSLPKFQKSITKNNSQGPFLKFLFLFSMPIIFAFYSSMSTYDDFLQYLFLILFLTNLFNSRHIIAALFFTIACISRETSLIYYFIIIAFFVIEKFDNKLKKASIWFFPGILYILFITQYLPSDILLESKDFMLEKRFFAWTKNFTPVKSLRESFTIIAIMTGLYAYILHRQFKFNNMKKKNAWYITSIIFILINLIIVSITGLIREARLLFIPIIFVLPIISFELEKTILKLRNIRFSLKREIIITIISLFIAFVFFSPNTLGTGYIYKCYAFLYFFIWFEIIALSLRYPMWNKLEERTV